MTARDRGTHIFRVSFKIIFWKLVLKLINDVFYVRKELHPLVLATIALRQELTHRVFVELFLLLLTIVLPLFLPIPALWCRLG